MPGIDELALAFDAACRQTGVPYAYMGAMAVMAWGEPRATQDVDALVELTADTAPRLAEALRARGLEVSTEDLSDSLRDGGHVSVWDPTSVFFVDIKPALKPMEREQVRAAVDVPFRHAALRIVRPEETVAFKLSFGSPKDLQDARSIVIRSPALDRRRLMDFADRLGVRDRVETLLAENA